MWPNRVRCKCGAKATQKWAGLRHTRHLSDIYWAFKEMATVHYILTPYPKGSQRGHKGVTKGSQRGRVNE